MLSLRCGLGVTDWQVNPAERKKPWKVNKWWIQYSCLFVLRVCASPWAVWLGFRMTALYLSQRFQNAKYVFLPFSFFPWLHLFIYFYVSVCSLVVHKYHACVLSHFFDSKVCFIVFTIARKRCTVSLSGFISYCIKSLSLGSLVRNYVAFTGWLWSMQCSSLSVGLISIDVQLQIFSLDGIFSQW